VNAAVSPATVALFEEALRHQWGQGASISLYGSSNRTPMTFVLERVAARLDRPLVAFWAAGGAPDVFCLRDDEAVAAVFNQRHLELSAQLLQLFTVPLEGELLSELAERLCLRVTGEFALRDGDSDLAVLCYVKGRVGESIVVPDNRNVLDLELGPINERYMFLWFFAFVHEFGHGRAASAENRRAMEDLLPDEAISSALRDGLDGENLLPEHREAAEQVLATSQLFSPANLREECSADLFGCEVLLQSTMDILRELSADVVDPVAFAVEHVIFLNIMMLIERCRMISEMASPRSTAAAPDAVIRLAVHHVAIQFRGRVAQWYLQAALANLYPKLGETRLAEAISEAQSRLSHRASMIQQGYRAALRYALGAKAKAGDHPLLDSFRTDMAAPIASATRNETRAFCQTARAMGVKGSLLDVLEGILERPDRPFSLPLSGAHRFIVAWVNGPDGFSEPYTLLTPHGPVAPAFLPQNPLFADLCEALRASLYEGYELKRVVFVVPRPEALGEVMLEHCSADAGFGLVWEGQPGFVDFLTDQLEVAKRDSQA